MWKISYLYHKQQRLAEPEITVHSCPDKISNQIQKCSEILKIWSDITTIYANFALFYYK